MRNEGRRTRIGLGRVAIVWGTILGLPLVMSGGAAQGAEPEVSELIRGRSPGKAWAAQTAHPFHWAAFQLSGDWR